MPYICRVASKKLDHLSIYGDDYDTPDGTGVRDYIHVMDLARGHVLALKKLEKEHSGLFIYNLGMGKGVSVLEMVETFKRVNKVDVPYIIAPRRPGDIATCYSNPSKAKEELGFTCEKTLEDMVSSAWNYEHKNI